MNEATMIKAMKQALEALMYCEPDSEENPKGFELWGEAMSVLKQAIREAENTTPVAWLYLEPNNSSMNAYCDDIDASQFPHDKWFPAYKLPNREWTGIWLGLHDEEIHQAFCHAEYETNHDWNDDPESWCKAFYRYVDAKLKEKNHG